MSREIDKLFKQIQRNSEIRRNCLGHSFSMLERFGKWKCDNCGCEADATFVIGYQQGLEHGGKVENNN